MINEIMISTPFIKLDSLLKFAGIAESGGQAHTLIKKGAVYVDGKICTQRGRKIVPGMKLEVFDQCFEVKSFESIRS